MMTAMSEQRLQFLAIELESVLPSGWGLLDGPGEWNPRRASWTTEVYDLADNHWTIEVRAAEAKQLGRLEALKRAVDKLYREALG